MVLVIVRNDSRSERNQEEVGHKKIVAPEGVDRRTVLAYEVIWLSMAKEDGAGRY